MSKLKNHLFHIVHFENVESILLDGILSHNEAYRRGLIKTDVSLQDVQLRRSRIHDPIFKRQLHDYASLYFYPRNPMLYYLKDLQNELVMIGVDFRVLGYDNTIFTDGNAASNETNFYFDVSDLRFIPLDKIWSDPYWNNYSDGKRVYCSEALIFPKVEVTDLRFAVCNNKKFFDNLISIFSETDLGNVDENFELILNRSIFF